MNATHVKDAKETLMRNKILRTSIVAVAYLALSGYSACDPIIENNGFDLWCGEKLCSWETETGTIARAPTWNPNDIAVDLVGGSVAISQLSHIDQGDVACMRFDLVAKVDETAAVTIELDFFDDGTVDWSKQIPTSDWAPLSYLITMPREYQGVRFRIKKLGSGRALVAQLQAESASGKCIAAPVELDPRRLGAACSNGDECQSGMCNGAGIFSTGTCSECATNDDCATDEVCGVETPEGAGFLDVYRGCGPAARRVLGERCALDAECVTGLCGEHLLCGTCTNAGDCRPGQTCTRPPTPGNPNFQGAWDLALQCSPGEAMGQTGDVCLNNTDCASSQCSQSDTLRVCTVDGRTCSDDKDCPTDLPCIAIGSAGGQCQ